jgi:hypothetical protein
VSLVVSQTPLAQQPVGHVCALQLEHTPLVHVPVPQLVQAWPKRPHCVLVAGSTHVLLVMSQQPAHVWALQPHWPKKHVLPAGHAGPVPHWHVPLAVQVSAVCRSQLVHAPPAAAHALADRGTQVEPEQQPFAQLVAVQLLQTPPVQVLPLVHAAQLRPPAPHAVDESPVAQVVALLQQPVQPLS